MKEDILMALKPNGGLCQIREQIIEDAASGLTLQFECCKDGTSRLRIYGDLPFGNREIFFDVEGKEGGAGTALASLCRPSWLREVTVKA
jgi:hypothetical protein